MFLSEIFLALPFALPLLVLVLVAGNECEF